VPWLFTTSIISSPNATTGHITGYAYLIDGRCWNLGTTIDPGIPIQIPPGATFMGYFTAYGKKVSLWQFSASTEYGPVNAQMAVNVADSTISFINVNGDVALGVAEGYFVFQNFTAKRPSPNSFNAPRGTCRSLFD